jgi:hypothetical protein
MMTEKASDPYSFCQGLTYSILQNPALKAGHQGFALGLVASHPGAGTTYLTNLLADSLNTDVSRSALVVDCRELLSLDGHSKRSIDATADLPKATANGHAYVPSFTGNWRGSLDFRATYLHQLRARFPYVLIDCPSLKESNDVLSVSSLIDGFFLVVEANRTQNAQLAYLERTLESSGGKIFGHLLNKRTYLIPDWLHFKMERLGL